jgi:N-acetylglucosamine-6-phosphate deacetylase
MTALLIINAKIISEFRVIPHGWLLIADERIVAFAEGQAPSFDHAQVLDIHGLTLAPGFIDVHVHGAKGHEMMSGTPQALQVMSAYYAQNGVTAYLPTSLTGSRADITQALQNVQQHQHQQWGATILGVHLEGPYLNVEKCGAQRPEHIRTAPHDEAREWLDLGVLRLVSVAPEFEANHWFMRECIQRGITVSLAHTSATYEQALAGIEMGISHATHTYNAMSPLQHRAPGVVGAVLGDERVRCEIICDLMHVHAGAIKTLYQAKGNAQTILITDSMSATGMPDGTYMLGEHQAVKQGAKVTLAENGTLAGSVLPYNVGVANFMQAVGKNFDDIWQTTSLTPAQAIHEAHQRGSIAIGKIADLVVIDEQIHVHHTFVRGALIPRAETT